MIENPAVYIVTEEYIELHVQACQREKRRTAYREREIVMIDDNSYTTCQCPSCQYIMYRVLSRLREVTRSLQILASAADGDWWTGHVTAGRVT